MKIEDNIFSLPLGHECLTEKIKLPKMWHKVINLIMCQMSWFGASD